MTCSILCVTDAYDLVSISIRPSSQGLESAGNVPVVPTGSDPLWAERTSVIRGRRNRNCGLSLRSRMPLQANAQFGKSAEKERRMAGEKELSDPTALPRLAPILAPAAIRRSE